MTSPTPCAPPERPRVVVSVVASADGRVTLRRAARLLDDDVGARWRRAWAPDTEDLLAQRASDLEARLHPTVVLEGSGTFVADEAPPVALPPADRAPAELWTDHLPRRTPRWFAVVDGRGRVPRTFYGDEVTGLLVLVCRATPLPYLAHLRREGIAYLLVGEERVDLTLALVTIGRTLAAAVPLRSTAVTVGPHGTIWSRYEVAPMVEASMTAR